MAFTDYIKFSGFNEDMKSRNFSLYGQWIGILLVFLCLALGIANIFHFSVVIVFAIIAIVQAPILAFVEIPFLLKIFRVPDWFILGIQKIDSNWMRVVFYALNAVIQWLSLTVQATSLLALAILFTIAAACYGIAAATHQDFHKSNVVASVDVGELPIDAQIRDAL
ncbi:hypothetical protein CANARDRAFT_197417 [[Candida] arabinofermentans NRRL YB-2248]|uniref:Golgi apparatus membrane protein TVP18 n=1 Tax=[Candida] arabinofermentans NRRL YB-2248 TaxID=983967 RepID=A0A1E4T2D0_9ASCO|nr:hypothetical protein CANARDRAFT_197417 [[Candida] arabinofermentans NRRL YB-2248]